MSILIKLLAEIVLSVLLKSAISERFRDRMMPFAVALYIASGAVAPFLGGIQFTLLMLFGYFLRAFLFDGFHISKFRKNPTLISFLVFWGWMILSMLEGDYPIFAMQYFTGSLVDSVFIGYFVGMWVLRNPDGWERLLRSLSIGVFIVLLILIKNGAVAESSLTDQNRLAIEVGAKGDETIINQNSVGLTVVALLPYPFLYLMGKFRGDRHSKLIKCLTICTFVLMAVILVRTGSRNACLTFLPIGVYLFFAKTSLRRGVRIFMRIVLVVGMLITIAYYIGPMSELRIFTASQESSGDITSGRLDHFKAHLYKRTLRQQLIGSGCMYDLDRMMKARSKPLVSNGHSMFFQMFKQSGYVGVFLFLLVNISVWRRGRKIGPRGDLARFLFFIWFFSGVAESSPILNELHIKFLLGLALAFCSKKQGLFDGQFTGQLRNSFCFNPFNCTARRGW